MTIRYADQHRPDPPLLPAALLGQGADADAAREDAGGVGEGKSLFGYRAIPITPCLAAAADPLECGWGRLPDGRIGTAGECTAAGCEPQDAGETGRHG